MEKLNFNRFDYKRPVVAKLQVCVEQGIAVSDGIFNDPSLEWGSDYDYVG